MALIEINSGTFGFGGSNVAPGSAGGSPTLGEVIAAQREDAFFPRFDWSTITQAVSSDLTTLVALVNVVVAQANTLAPVGARAFGVRTPTPDETAVDVDAYMFAQCNGLKAMLLATASADYTALSAVAAASDLATAIVLANAIRTALGIT